LSNRSIYFPNELEKKIIKLARAEKKSVSEFVCEQVQKALKRKAKK
jgi:hypothetical protein